MKDGFRIGETNLDPQDPGSELGASWEGKFRDNESPIHSVVCEIFQEYKSPEGEIDAILVGTMDVPINATSCVLDKANTRLIVGHRSNVAFQGDVVL